MMTKLDVTSITVGFDLRVQQIPIRIPSDCSSVRYQLRTGKTATFGGTPEQIAHELERVGYAVWSGAAELGSEHDGRSACGDENSGDQP